MTIRPSVATTDEVVAVLQRFGGRLLRSKLLWLLAGSYLLFGVFSRGCFTYVPPGMVGVKQVYMGSSSGIQAGTYSVGTYLMIPGFERLHLIPSDMQALNFSDSSAEASRGSRTAPGIKVQTSDGYNVLLDVTVLYRVVDAYKVFKEAGVGRAFEDRLVVPNADRILRKTLGELNSEEMYAGPRRIEKSRLAQELLAAELKPKGLRVDAVLVRRYTYDERYQHIIESRNIKNQTVFLRQAEAKAAIEQRKRDTTIAKGAAEQGTEISRGGAEVQKLKSESELYRRQKAAEGKLKVDLAEAKGTELENAALEGAGSENMVGLKMAEVLEGVKVVVLQSDGADGFNPLDLGSVLKKFEVR